MPDLAKPKPIREFLDELKTQRWDDHRYYHHRMINQSLHFISATTFACADCCS